MEEGSIVIKTRNKATIICVVKMMVRNTLDESSFSGNFVLNYIDLKIRQPKFI